MKITRRDLLVVAAAVGVPVQAQGPGDMNATSDALNKVRIPASAEPAFAFKA